MFSVIMVIISYNYTGMNRKKNTNIMELFVIQKL